MLEYRAKASNFGAWLERNVGKIGYLIGTRGEICTAELIADRRLRFPSYRVTIDRYAAQWLNKVVADCMGTYEMFLSGGEWNKPLTVWRYSDVSTGVVLSLALSEKLPSGTISTLPKGLPYPIAVCYSGHVGFYYKGMVYQSSGHAYGLEITDLASTAHNHEWTNWYYLPWLDYEEGDIMIQSGDGPNRAVYDLQTIYQKLGEDIGKFKNMLDPAILDGRDGKYGATCIGITKKLRTKYGLPVADYVDAALYGKLGLALMAIPSGIPQAQYDAEKARADAAVLLAAELQDDLDTANEQLASKTDELIKMTDERDEYLGYLHELARNKRESDAIISQF
jgi:hypothetical protein